MFSIHVHGFFQHYMPSNRSQLREAGEG